jgi:hypothetical protein
VPQKTSAYVSQNDLHVGEMTVRETMEFSAKCQGVGTRYGEFRRLSAFDSDLSDEILRYRNQLTDSQIVSPLTDRYGRGNECKSFIEEKCQFHRISTED